MNFNKVISKANLGSPGVYDPTRTDVPDDNLFFVTKDTHIDYSIQAKNFAGKAWTGSSSLSILISEWTEGRMLIASGHWFLRLNDAVKHLLDNGGNLLRLVDGDVHEIKIGLQAGKEHVDIGLWKSRIANGESPYIVTTEGKPTEVRLGHKVTAREIRSVGKTNRAQTDDGFISTVRPFSQILFQVQTTPSSRASGRLIRPKGLYLQERRNDLFFVLVGSTDPEDTNTKRLKLEPGEVEWIKVNGIRIY